MKVNLTRITGDPILAIEEAASNCYDSIPSEDGKILRLKKKDIESADHWFDTKGSKTVFFCRFIPIVRSLISIPAGMSEMPMLKFIIFAKKLVQV